MLLLHACCAPCALPIIEYLINDKKEDRIALYFENSNIYPKEEYKKRLAEVKKIAKIYGLDLIESKYEHQKWLDFLKNKLPKALIDYPENDLRCLICFQFRLLKTALRAQTAGFKEFSTTLSINRFKDIDFINQYGQKSARENNLTYVQFPLDPQEAHQKEKELRQKHNLYSQKYCGCEFSLPKNSRF